MKYYLNYPNCTESTVTIDVDPLQYRRQQVKSNYSNPTVDSACMYCTRLEMFCTPWLLSSIVQQMMLIVMTHTSHPLIGIPPCPNANTAQPQSSNSCQNYNLVDNGLQKPISFMPSNTFINSLVDTPAIQHRVEVCWPFNGQYYPGEVTEVHDDGAQLIV